MKNRLNNDIAFWHWARARQARGGTSWSSYWAQQLTPAFERIYYGWDNQGLGTDAVKNFQVAYEISGQSKAIMYLFNKNTDAHYDVVDTNLVTLTYKQLGARSNYTTLIYNTPTTTGDKFTFTGTGLKIWVYKSPNFGIIGCIRYNGNFGGRISTNGTVQAWVAANKQEDDYFYVYDTGNYSGIHASLSSLSAGDLIHYTGGAWSIIPAASVTYTEIDCYSTSTAYIETTAFSDLPFGTYRVGFFGTMKKNESSSAVDCFVRRDITLPVRLYTVETIGATTYNSYNHLTMVQLTQDAGHFEMSTNIKRNGTAQTAQWIPAHSGTNTLTWHSGENIRIWVDGTEASGYRNNSSLFTEVSEIITQNITYAVNTGAATEELLKITTDSTFNSSGYKSKNTYECLIETLCTAGYSYMIPYGNPPFTKFVTFLKEKVALPAVSHTQNITDGPSIDKFLLYDDTVGATYENYVMNFRVNNVVAANRGSSQIFYLSTFGTTYGKLYTPVFSNTVLAVGETWETEIEVTVGYVSDLINKVAAFLV